MSRSKPGVLSTVDGPRNEREGKHKVVSMDDLLGPGSPNHGDGNVTRRRARVWVVWIVVLSTALKLAFLPLVADMAPVADERAYIGAAASICETGAPVYESPILDEASAAPGSRVLARICARICREICSCSGSGDRSVRCSSIESRVSVSTVHDQYEQYKH